LQKSFVAISRVSRFALTLWTLSLMAVFFAVFRVHLAQGALFWDEWLYISEIQAAPSYAAWIFSPSTAHVFIIPKAITALIYHFFGVWFFPYKLASITLHAASAVALFYFIRLRASLAVSALITTVFTLTTSYEEILAWSAHYREQFFILLFFLWNYLALSAIDKKKPLTPWERFIPPCVLCGMTLSFANILFGSAFGILFCIFYFKELQKSRALLPHVASILVSISLYAFLYRSPIAAQSAQQAGDLTSLSTQRLIQTSLNAVEFIRLGILERLFSPTTRVLPALIITALGTLLFILPLLKSVARVDRREFKYSIWLLTCTLFVVFSQAWYRKDLQFILTWNKYSFMPIALLLPALAQALQLSSKTSRVALSVILVITCVARIFPPLRPSYNSLTGSASVQSLVQDFENAFLNIPTEHPSLLTFQIPWDVFIGGYSPTTAMLWRAHPELRNRAANFIEGSSTPSQQQLVAISQTIKQAQLLRSFYDKYLPRVDAPPAGDGGIVAPTAANQAFIQEVRNPTANPSYLRGIVLVLGTSSQSNTSRITLGVYDSKMRKIHQQTVSASQVLNNQPTELEVPETRLITDPLFIALQIETPASSPPVAIYKTKLPLPHLGRSWICDEGQSSDIIDLRDCVLQEASTFGMLGVGLKLSPLPSF
jgi:hypothetical protein